MRKLAALIATLCLFVLPASAGAAVPHGDSGSDEYTEDIPGGGGNHPSDDVGGGHGGGQGTGASSGSPASGAVPPGTVQELQSQGTAGDAAANFAQASAPASPGSNQGSRGAGANGAGGGASGSTPGGGSGAGIGGAGADDGGGSGSALGELVNQVTQGDSEGMGIALPLILAAAALIAFLVALGRRRGRGHTTT